MDPLLSIITATYNSDKTLERTILSILNQDFKNLEYIIIDGDSKDGTIDIIKKYEAIFLNNNIAFRWISEPDKGIYNAWNKGLKLVKGNWVSFLGSDDIYLEGALSKYKELAKSNVNADLLYSKVKLVKDGKLIREIKKKWYWNTFRRYMEIAHVGSFHNAYYFEKYGYFNEEYSIAGDYEMLLRAKDKLTAIYLDEYTIEMEDGGVSNNFVSKAFKEAKKAKINTAEVSTILANLDYFYAYVKYYGGRFKRLLNLK